ncbi:hypothetical protein GJ496_007611 [Pomphorhynchus laevis]|nr:hypothetical protein GJ496_007611 [Pomphorhynchus laevis]
MLIRDFCFGFERHTLEKFPTLPHQMCYYMCYYAPDMPISRANLTRKRNKPWLLQRERQDHLLSDSILDPHHPHRQC